MIYLQFLAVPIGGAILFGLGYMILGLWNECGAAWKAVSDRDEQLTEAKQRICDLLRDNELANKECEQNRIVIEAAKEERLKLLNQQGKDANELMELREVRMSSANVIASMDQRIEGLLKDIDAINEDRLKMLDIHDETVNESVARRIELLNAKETVMAQRKKIGELATDVDERSRVMLEQARIIEKYRAVVNGTPARGENGRFARRQVAG